MTPSGGSDMQPSRLLVLWAQMPERSPSSPWPQFVAAFSDGEVEAWPEMHAERRKEAEEWYSAFGDDSPERFFTTYEDVARPAFPAAKKEPCAICAFPSDELNGEGECPGCVDEREAEDAELAQ